MAKKNIQPTIEQLHTYVIVRCMVRAGWDRQEACKALGIPLPETLKAGSHVPMTEFFQLCHKANEVAGDPLYCLKLGKFCHPIDYGILGKLAMFSVNIGEAFKMIYRYQNIVNSAISNSMVFTDELMISPVTIGDYDAELVAPLIEFRLSAFFNIGHFVTGAMHPQLFHEVCFQHSAKGEHASYRKILGTPVRFEQPRSSFSMSKQAMQIPIFCADADLNRVALNHAEEAASDTQNEIQLKNRIKEHIRPQLFLGLPSQEQLAEQFGMSTTKLKRLLSEEGTNFRDVCNELRCSSAKHLLLTTNKSINEVGIMLGFSQPSSFVRSFKGWTDKTPQQFRHQQR